MKKQRLLGLVALVAVFFITSCNKEKELTKYISSDKVELTGDRTDLFEIDADSVKVMLIPVGAEGKKWEVRTIVPIRNTTPWSQIPESDRNRSSFISGVSMYIKYLDGYGSSLDMSIDSYYPNVEKVLKSDDLITEDMAIAEMSFGDKSYKKQKAYFDKIEGIKIQVSLSWTQVASGSSSTKSSSTNNWDKLLDDYEKCVNECVKLLGKEDRGEYVSEKKIDDLLDKADELEIKLDKWVDDMSEAQYRRYMRIGDKLDAALL